MKLTDSQRMMIQTKGVVIGRMLLALLFVVSGLGMLVGLLKGTDMTAGYYEAVGVPMAGLMVWLAALLKVIAGGALLIGKRVGAAASALIAFTLLATLFGHNKISDPMQLTQALKNLSIVGGLLYVIAFGAGNWDTKK